LLLKGLCVVNENYYDTILKLRSGVLNVVAGLKGFGYNIIFIETGSISSG